MKLKGLIEQLNQLAKERPEALEMEVSRLQYYDSINMQSFMKICDIKIIKACPFSINPNLKKPKKELVLIR